MSDGVFNISLGRVAYYATLPAASDQLTVVLLQTAQADDTLNNHATLSAILLAANTEATFDNYARKPAAGVVVTPNNTSNLVDADFNDVTWTDAGGVTPNTLVKLIVCYDPDGTDTDTSMIPLTHHDFSVTTDGSSITAQVAATGFFRATQ